MLYHLSNALCPVEEIRCNFLAPFFHLITLGGLIKEEREGGRGVVLGWKGLGASHTVPFVADEIAV